VDFLRKLIPDVRFQIVRLALVGVKNHDDWEYEEVRPLVVAWPGYLSVKKVIGDCGWFVKCVFWRAGASDPMDTNYGPDGNSESLWQHARHIEQKQIHKGDVVTFGPGGETHAAIIVTVAEDPVCASFGRPGAPELVTVSALVSSIESIGKLALPVTYCRFNTRNRRLKRVVS
jgi:hypothetical protein